jgi:hypothetical protein
MAKRIIKAGKLTPNVKLKTAKDSGGKVTGR